MGKKSIDELQAFGLAVRTLRKRAGVSQDALADISGLHRTYVGSVERGERNISLLNIHVLAAALEITVSKLMRIAEQIRDESKRTRNRQGDPLREYPSGTHKR